MTAAQLRRLAIAWLRAHAPGSVIVVELSVADWGGASIDVAAISPTHVIGIEIKGEGDSPARLARQGLAYGMVAKEMWLLPDESLAAKCRAQAPSGWGVLELWNDAVRPWNRAMCGAGWEKTSWGQRLRMVRDDSRYEPDRAAIRGHLCPAAMCGALWRDELAEIAKRVGGLPGIGRSATVGPLTEAIMAHLPAPVIHDEMVAALRRRAWRKPVIDDRPDAERVDETKRLL